MRPAAGAMRRGRSSRSRTAVTYTVRKPGDVENPRRDRIPPPIRLRGPSNSSTGFARNRAPSRALAHSAYLGSVLGAASTRARNESASVAIARQRIANPRATAPRFVGLDDKHLMRRQGSRVARTTSTSRASMSRGSCDSAATPESHASTIAPRELCCRIRLTLAAMQRLDRRVVAVCDEPARIAISAAVRARCASRLQLKTSIMLPSRASLSASVARKLREKYRLSRRGFDRSRARPQISAIATSCIPAPATLPATINPTRLRPADSGRAAVPAIDFNRVGM